VEVSRQSFLALGQEHSWIQKKSESDEKMGAQSESGPPQGGHAKGVGAFDCTPTRIQTGNRPMPKDREDFMGNGDIYKIFRGKCKVFDKVIGQI